MSSGTRASNGARFSATSLLAVALGGLLGACARIGMSLLWPDSSAFPATTLLVNVLGSAGLGACTAWWSERPDTPAWLRAGIGTGFFGAFTTFSTLIFFTLGAPLTIAVLYTAISLVLCAGAAWAAMRLVELTAPGRPPSPTSPANTPPGDGRNDQ